LINHLLGQKVSIVSRKVQTTRFTTKGILNIKNTGNNKPDCQIIFVDTPGLFEPQKALEKHIVNNTISELDDYEHICILYDATSNKKKFLEFSKIVNKINLKKKSSSLIINKIDLVEKENLLSIIQNIQKIFEFQNVFMISAKKGQGCKDLIEFLQSTIPHSPFLYDIDQLTDLSERVFSSEITREKLFNYLNSELPYNLYVDTLLWKETKKSITIHQNINVSKYNHKRIIIGKNGENLKKIGTSSRKDLEKIFNKKVHLFLFIKIKSNWMTNIKEINHLGQN
tara:strand:+ start:172 stop:1020 length:849 start_codon:yes stop_codon:yes gene_type:complete